MESKLEQIGMDAIRLVRCALHGQRLQQGINSDPEELYTFCEFHSITAMAAMALETLQKEEPSEQIRKFQQARARAMRKSILLNAEREQILRHLEEIGCWYMPLKGSLLQYDYPQFGMRQMGDNDILIDPAGQEKVHEFFCGRGYEVKSYQMMVVNNYHKAPVYNFEMHTALFGLESPKEFREYYSDVEARLIPDEGKRYGRHFSREDFYIYMIAHAWKHARHGGIGIRFLADIWVYLRKYREQLNWEYVGGELEKLGAGEFERGCRQLAGKLFDSPDGEAELSAGEQETLRQFMTAGAYGTLERKMTNRLNEETGRGAKLRYMVSRIFPSAETLSLVHPHVMEQRWRVPLIWIWRLIRAVFVCPRDTVREIAMLIRKKDR